MPKQRDNTIDELNAEIARLNGVISDAKADIKRLIRGEYETVCELCELNGRCYCLDKYACHRHSRWRGSINYSDTGGDVNVDNEEKKTSESSH